MSEEIQKFDPSKLMQGVKDRIKSEFVSLIPDEQWSQMIQIEIDLFFTKKEAGGYNRAASHLSDFQIVVNRELENHVKSKLKDFLHSEKFLQRWNNVGEPIASEAIEEMFVKNSGKILSDFFGGMFQMKIEQFRSSF